MDHQLSFSDAAYISKKKTTRKERFLSEMDAVLPWDDLLQPILRHYPKPGQGRRPIPASVMLRIYFMQQWYGLSDPGMEDSLYDVESMRRFAGVGLDAIFAIFWNAMGCPRCCLSGRVRICRSGV